MIPFGGQLAGCASGVEKYDSVQDAEKAKPGKDYKLVFYPGLPGVPDSHPALWTAKQYKQVQYLFAHGCYESLMPQLAGTRWKSIGIETGKSIIANALASPLSVVPFSPGSGLLRKYVESGALSGGPNGANYGNTIHAQAVKGDTGQCMSWMIYFAQQDGQLNGIGVVTDYDSVDGNALPMPGGPEIAPSDEDVARAKANATRPPPMLGH